MADAPGLLAAFPDLAQASEEAPGAGPDVLFRAVAADRCQIRLATRIEQHRVVRAETPCLFGWQPASPASPHHRFDIRIRPLSYFIRITSGCRNGTAGPAGIGGPQPRIVRKETIMRHRQSGFTLIEIAIVLVIIGLLLGGVLKGQELINQAKIKNVINDLNGVTTAVYGYQDRYKAQPGNDPGATGRWSGTYTIANGSGFDSGAFWQELRAAGFLNGSASDAGAPTNAVGGTLSATLVTTSGGGSSLLGYGTQGLAICSQGIPGKIAESVDVQLDDGKPATGSVRAFTTSPATAASSYVDDSNTVYTVCKAL
jgi:prepilin-type N-terminal cleavage/methylation domain-containing protein